ncbi:nitrous oxide reductase family maturation protein NosD [Riemerella columbipharyngis]|uniref:Nitrous oxidase accessory protein n=1 Tax=Riemerella columbipharyngis TaxID=1071918 RepID=A0A1G7C6Q5_9FLAO|nr:nitrous oxide reductase family maturation protein NosD [Riemerella columbipharyngis]SDE35074.1 nitrous oxidase accessory protein [Riemerella columbipharyngis]
MAILKYWLCGLGILTALNIQATTYSVGRNKTYKTIHSALKKAKSGDTILVYGGHYKEGNINLDKSITLIGIDRPILDGEMKYEIVSFRANHIVLEGFKIMNSGKDEIRNIGAVRLYDSHFSTIKNNIFDNNYFGITIQRGYQCLVQNNKITTSRGASQELIGDGIHVWSSSDIWIKNNFIKGHKDGIYLEKANNTFVYKNNSQENKRYGLHFMFSHNNVYIGNVFRNNEAGVAVMYSRNVKMKYNRFLDNWGDNVYGLLLKELTFSKVSHNVFSNNSIGVFTDGSSKIDFYNNQFQNNGWGLKINTNCVENKLINNNFVNNIFDISTSGTVFLNTFKHNYWDKYEGYDLDRNAVGDIPFYPLSLYSVLSEKTPMIMILFGTFFVELINRSEKLMPTLTPDTFVDEQPSMKPNKI